MVTAAVFYRLCEEDKNGLDALRAKSFLNKLAVDRLLLDRWDERRITSELEPPDDILLLRWLTLPVRLNSIEKSLRCRCCVKIYNIWREREKKELRAIE